jgi:hypothetical protein
VAFCVIPDPPVAGSWNLEDHQLATQRATLNSGKVALA